MQSDEIKAVADEIASRLGETAPDPVHQIRLLVQYLGADLVRRKMEEALQLEQTEGIMTQDGVRRRTPGGVFFFIIKRDMNPKVRLQIFPNFGQGRKLASTIDWEKRMATLEPIIAAGDFGSAHQVRLHLLGRPGKVEVADDTVLMIFEHFNEASPKDEEKSGLPQLPRGVPVPPTDSTRYIVYMGINQWERVSKALENPKDQLMIDGAIFWDKAMDSMAVFALGVTTREIERRQRRQERIDKQQSEQKAQASVKAAAQNKAGKKGDDKSAKGKPNQKKTAAPSDSTASDQAAPAVTAAPSVVEAASDEASDRLQKLYATIETLRERIATKESQGQRASMEQKLLQVTEKQIEALKKQS